jgi:hypothetical protein
MAVSVEIGSQNLEAGIHAGRQDGGHQEQAEQAEQVDDEKDVGIQYVATNTESPLDVKDIPQLLSPTPSPRSSSPPLVVSNESGDLTGTRHSHPNGRRYSGPFEKHVVSVTDSGKVEKGMLSSQLPVLKIRPPTELRHIPEEKVRESRKLSSPRLNGSEKVLKLTAAEMEELTSAPESLPVTSPRSAFSRAAPLSPSPVLERRESTTGTSHFMPNKQQREDQPREFSNSESSTILSDFNTYRQPTRESTPVNGISRRPGFSSRAASSPQVASTRIPSYLKGSTGQPSPRRRPVPPGSHPEHPAIDHSSLATGAGTPSSVDPPPSPVPQSIPLPPMSIPTYLQLELASSKPSPLYIYHSSSSDKVYESSKIKFERLLNFLLLPPQLEQVLYFGSLACLDAWLYTFTILPLRFFKAAFILFQWWGQSLAKEIQFMSGFIYHGLGRMWHRQRARSGSTDSVPRSRKVSRASRPQASTTPSYQSHPGRTSENSSAQGINEYSKVEPEHKTKQGWGRTHRRTKSQPSSLSTNHKADLLQGAVIICSCIILMKLDASRMYHSIRGQAAIKLYVIYNVLEVNPS